LLIAVLVALTGFVGWHFGIPAYERSAAVPEISRSEVLTLPEQVYDPPLYAPATDTWGPPGPLSMVFRGVTARTGFGDEVEQPWFAVSARDGEYHRLAAPSLDRSVDRVWLSPQGTQVAWRYAGGIGRYDTMTGEADTYAVAGVEASTALVWSPDSARLAFGTDPVRVLDSGTGEVTALPLRVPGTSVTTPAWTQDGDWVSVTASGRLEAVHVGTGRRRSVQARVDGSGIGGFRDADWNAAGDVAGLHRVPRLGRNVVRVIHAPRLAPRGRAGVDDESPEDLVVQRFLGWGDDDEVVLTGLRPETGQIEQAVVMSLPDDALRTFTLFPTLGDNWVGASTVSVAADYLSADSEDYERPPIPWSPGAKLLLCLLVAVFPMVYYLIARRPRA
jgi:hypothetical protein